MQRENDVEPWDLGRSLSQTNTSVSNTLKNKQQQVNAGSNMLGSLRRLST
jgi:hypothetical protein